MELGFLQTTPFHRRCGRLSRVIRRDCGDEEAGAQKWEIERYRFLKIFRALIFLGIKEKRDTEVGGCLKLLGAKKFYGKWGKE